MYVEGHFNVLNRFECVLLKNHLSVFQRLTYFLKCSQVESFKDSVIYCTVLYCTSTANKQSSCRRLLLWKC